MTKLETHNINSDGQIMPNHIEQVSSKLICIIFTKSLVGIAKRLGQETECNVFFSPSFENIHRCLCEKESFAEY